MAETRRRERANAKKTWVFVVFCPVRMTSLVLQHA